MGDRLCDICQRPLDPLSARQYSAAEWTAIVEAGFSVIACDMSFFKDGEEKSYRELCEAFGVAPEEIDRRIRERRRARDDLGGMTICADCDRTVSKYAPEREEPADS